MPIQTDLASSLIIFRYPVKMVILGCFILKWMVNVVVNYQRFLGVPNSLKRTVIATSKKSRFSPTPTVNRKSPKSKPETIPAELFRETSPPSSRFTRKSILTRSASRSTETYSDRWRANLALTSRFRLSKLISIRGPETTAHQLIIQQTFPEMSLW